MEQNLIFSCLRDNSNGVLAPEDLHFFYYDVGLDSLTGIPSIYEDNEDVLSFIDSKKLEIKVVEQSILPTSFQDGHIYFIQEKCDKSKYDAFFRHLRNAFSHYHIAHQGDFFLMNDYHDKACNEMTMIGKIKCEDLMNLCFLLFGQREKV